MWIDTLSQKTEPVIAVTLKIAAAFGDRMVTRWPVTVMRASKGVKLKLYSIALLVKSPSVGTPEMIPVWASMWRPAGSEDEKARASPAAGAPYGLGTAKEKDRPSWALWLGFAVAGGPPSPT